MSFIKNLLSGSGSNILSSVTDIIGKFKADPTKVVEIEAEIEKLKIQHDAKMQELENQLESEFSKRIAAVNATMQAEAKSEHWAQWLWRPMVGFTFCGILINNFILLPYFKNKGLLPVEISYEVWMVIGAILGVASWGRAQVKQIAAKK